MVRTKKILVIRPGESGGVAVRPAASYACVYALAYAIKEVSMPIVASWNLPKLEQCFYWYKKGIPFRWRENCSNGNNCLFPLLE